MANGLYKLGAKKFLDGGINLLSDTIKVAIVDAASYTPNLTTHEFHSDLAGIIGTPVALGSKTTNLGVFDAADHTQTSVAAGTYEYLVIYKDTGVSGTSPLICIFDTATGLPLTASGGDVTVTWNGSGIFSIA